MRPLTTSSSVVAAAVAEGRRRAARSDRDLTSLLAHYELTVPQVCREWGLTAVGWFAAGAGMPPLDVRRRDGARAVLKIGDPDDLAPGARVMQAADGRGYVLVLEWDREAGALLVERLGADLWTEHRTLVEQAQVVVPLLLDAWTVPVSAGQAFTGKAAALALVLDELGPRYADGLDAVRLARAWARELASTEVPQVVCHGDPHGGNVLRRGSGWALVDPDGFVGEREYDLGVVLRDACHELVAAEESAPGAAATLLRTGAEQVAGLARVDVDRVWRWGLVERVTTGLHLAWHGHGGQAQTFFRTASLLARTC